MLYMIMMCVLIKGQRKRWNNNNRRRGEGDNDKEEKNTQERKRTCADGGRTRLAALGRLLVGDGLLFAHGGDDGDEEVLAVVEVGLDLLAELALGDLDVVLRVAVLGHEVEEAVIDVDLRKTGRLA